jgi:thiopeptide-type bacteriocin biosynthesis protein
VAGDEYRQRKKVLRRLLGDREHLLTEPGGDALRRILDSRRAELSQISRQLAALANSEQLSRPINTLVRAFVHLHYNRLLTGTRLSEEQILELLGRTRLGLSEAPLDATKKKARKDELPVAEDKAPNGNQA